MRMLIAAALLACGAAACGSVAAPPSERSSERPSSAQQMRLLVKPRAGVTLAQLDEILSHHGARRIEVIQQINVHIVVVSPHADARDVAQKLRQNPHIEFVEIDEKLPPAGPKARS